MHRASERSEFSKWKINLDHYCLENENKEELFIEPRLLKLLDVLKANAGKVVKRGDLIELVWKDVIVTEESLSKAVFDLRKFLAENFKDSPQIVTIRKVGYKLVLQASSPRRDKYRILRLGGKVLVYMIGFLVLLGILIRAIRYEN